MSQALRVALDLTPKLATELATAPPLLSTLPLPARLEGGASTPCYTEFVRLLACLQSSARAAECAGRYAELVVCLRKWGL